MHIINVPLRRRKHLNQKYEPADSGVARKHKAAADSSFHTRYTRRQQGRSAVEHILHKVDWLLHWIGCLSIFKILIRTSLRIIKLYINHPHWSFNHCSHMIIFKPSKIKSLLSCRVGERRSLKGDIFISYSGSSFCLGPSLEKVHVL